jgi:DNA-binding CsgD family transcriptional regulator
LGFTRALGVARGYDVAGAARGLGLESIDPDAPGARIDWDELATYVNRLFEGCSVEEMQAAGEDYVKVNAWFALALPLFATPRLFYYGVAEMSTRLDLVPHMRRELEPHETHLHVEFHLPDRFEPCPAFFHGFVGQYRMMNTLFGLPRARVEADAGPRHGVFDVYYTTPATRLDQLVERGRDLYQGAAGEFRRLLGRAMEEAETGTTVPPSNVLALQRVHGLTLTEAKVAARLAGGRNVAEIAAALGISIGTVRTHLKGAYAKTGARTQAELVCVVLGARAP